MRSFSYYLCASAAFRCRNTNNYTSAPLHGALRSISTSLRAAPCRGASLRRAVATAPLRAALRHQHHLPQQHHIVRHWRHHHHLPQRHFVRRWTPPSPSAAPLHAALWCQLHCMAHHFVRHHFTGTRGVHATSCCACGINITACRTTQRFHHFSTVVRSTFASYFDTDALYICTGGSTP